jgi:hypothetical protein
MHKSCVHATVFVLAVRVLTLRLLTVHVLAMRVLTLHLLTMHVLAVRVLTVHAPTLPLLTAPSTQPPSSLTGRSCCKAAA